VSLLRRERDNPATTSDAQAELRITVKATDPKAVGKAFTAPIVESALATYPGMFPTAPPADGSPYGVYWPTTVPADLVTQTVTLDDGVGAPAAVATCPSGRSSEVSFFSFEAHPGSAQRWLGEPTERVALGTFVGARSGDKGGNANAGLWIRRSGDDALDRVRYEWLVQFIDADRVRQLLPEAAALGVEIHTFINLRAVNVVIHGLLGRGVADSTALDPQAKGLGEHLRARYVDVPTALLAPGGA
jgi:hypothetical protein